MLEGYTVRSGSPSLDITSKAGVVLCICGKCAKAIALSGAQIEMLKKSPGKLKIFHSCSRGDLLMEIENE